MNAGISINDALTPLLEMMQSNHDSGKKLGLLSGIVELDSSLYGLGAGEMVVLAGRPGMGHGDLALRIAMNIAHGITFRNTSVQSAAPILHLSTKNKPFETTLKMMSLYCDLAPHHLLSGHLTDDHWQVVSNFVGLVYRLPITLQTVDCMQPESLLEVANEFINSKELVSGLIIIETIDHPTADFFKVIKKLSMQKQVPILVIVDLDHCLEQRSDNAPRLGDLPLNGLIEQFADVIMLFYREVYYSPSDKNNSFFVNIAKSPFGPIRPFTIPANFQ